MSGGADTAAADIVIASTGLTVSISPDGAELRRIVDDAGHDLLWDGDPAFWTGRAPILFPIVGALHDGGYTIDGQRHAMGKHGFARRSRFSVVEQGIDQAVLRLEDTDATRAMFPFAFRLDIAFLVKGSVLAVTATLTNPDAATTLPASFGFHPALRWPLPYGDARADHVVRFDRIEAAPIRRIDGDGLLEVEPRPTPIEDHMLHLADDLFVDDAVIFDRLESRGLWYGAVGGTGMRIEFPDMPYLGIWTKPGAGYVCIEPWQGIADPVGYDGDFRDKPGIVSLAPGADRSFAIQLEFGVSA